MEKRINEENKEEVMLLEENIQRLQVEVAQLQRQRQRRQEELALHSSQPLRDALLLVCGHGPKEDARMALSSLREEVEQLEEDLQRQTKMNGISLRSCTARILQSGSTKSVQEMCVCGQCSELDFQVEFQLSEIKGGERPEKSVDSLNVVTGASDLCNFSRFLTGVEESRELLMFFRTLRTFSDRMNERRHAFRHFQAKYGQVACAAGGSNPSVLTFHHPNLPGCTFLVHWSVDVSKEGEVTPKVDLLTKIPDRALQLFPSQGVGSADEAFHSLLRLLGPEAAVEEVIRAAGLLTNEMHDDGHVTAS
ncbi:centromere protein P [Syngnathus typhle]|uniref:centromere protein P n=1 Tax=Syngnathus typhle TaxID=161592 RepID=UPI002A6B7A83|nr:centromere protein P [Syngnathus typhle]